MIDGKAKHSPTNRPTTGTPRAGRPASHVSTQAWSARTHGTQAFTSQTAQTEASRPGNCSLAFVPRLCRVPCPRVHFIILGDRKNSLHPKQKCFRAPAPQRRGPRVSKMPASEERTSNLRGVTTDVRWPVPSIISRPPHPQKRRSAPVPRRPRVASPHITQLLLTAPDRPAPPRTQWRYCVCQTARSRRCTSGRSAATGGERVGEQVACPAGRWRATCTRSATFRRRSAWAPRRSNLTSSSTLAHR